MNVEFDMKRIEDFCRRRGIARLELFGSALGSRFTKNSDVDLLATLRPEAHPTLLDWAEMQEELGEIVGRRVDLVSRRAVERSKNLYRKNSILGAVEPVYAEG